MNLFAVTSLWNAAFVGSLMVFLAGASSYYLRPALGRWALRRSLQQHATELDSLKRTVAGVCAESLPLTHLLEALSPELLALDSIRSPGMNPKQLIDDTFAKCRDKHWTRQPRFIRNRLYSSARKRLMNVLVDVFETFNDTLLAHTNTHQWFSNNSQKMDMNNWVSKLPKYFQTDIKFWWYLTVLTVLGACVASLGHNHKLAWLILASITGIAVFQSPARNDVDWFQLICCDLAPKGILFFQSEQNMSLLNKVLQRRCDSLIGARERTTLQLLLGPFQYHIWRQHLQATLAEQLSQALANKSMVYSHIERIEQAVPAKTRDLLTRKINVLILHESAKHERKAAWCILALFSILFSSLWW